ncbi:MAG: cytochrome c family protein [Desulfobulbus sp.]|nr:cytochrome c family protein [Desulfobulbus sp.]
MKKRLIHATTLLGIFALAAIGAVNAEDKGPADIALQAAIDPANTPKPAQFPHGAHQSRLDCAICHHGKGPEDGKRIAYAAGQKIEKCETCHNSKAGMPDKVNTFKNAAHSLCQDCHRKSRPELANCTTCHGK